MEFYNKDSIQDILKKEESRIYAYIDMQKPFDYIRMINKTYCANQFDMSLDNNNNIPPVFDFALDSYLWYKQNGVHHYTTFYSLRQTLEMMLKYTKS